MGSTVATRASHLASWWSLEARVDVVASATALALGVAALTVSLLVL